MTEPVPLHPHRPVPEDIELENDADFIGPPEQPEPTVQFKLALAQQVHNVVTTLLNATAMLEQIPDQAWDASFALIGDDLIDTAHAAAAQSRAAYEKALAVEVMVARAMR